MFNRTRNEIDKLAAEMANMSAEVVKLRERIDDLEQYDTKLAYPPVYGFFSHPSAKRYPITTVVRLLLEHLHLTITPGDTRLNPVIPKQAKSPKPPREKP